MAEGLRALLLRDAPGLAAGSGGVGHLFAAGLGQRPKLEYPATLPGADPDLDWTGVAASNWTSCRRVTRSCIPCLRRALADLYGWYGERGQMLFRVTRDLETMPAPIQQVLLGYFDGVRAVLMASRPERRRARTRISAAIGPRHRLRDPGTR